MTDSFFILGLDHCETAADWQPLMKDLLIDSKIDCIDCAPGLALFQNSNLFSQRDCGALFSCLLVFSFLVSCSRGLRFKNIFIQNPKSSSWILDPKNSFQDGGPTSRRGYSKWSEAKILKNRIGHCQQCATGGATRSTHAEFTGWTFRGWWVWPAAPRLWTNPDCWNTTSPAAGCHGHGTSLVSSLLLFQKYGTLWYGNRSDGLHRTCIESGRRASPHAGRYQRFPSHETSQTRHVSLLILIYCKDLTFFFLFSNPFPILLDEKYVARKGEVVKAEQRILKELGFCVHVKHPHKVRITYLGLRPSRKVNKSRFLLFCSIQLYFV